jgi:hypothetical protein
VDLASASAAAAIGVATTVRDEEDCQDRQDKRLDYWTQDQNSSFTQYQSSKVCFDLFPLSVDTCFLLTSKLVLSDKS